MAAALAPASKLTAAETRLPTILVQRHALRVAGLGEDPNAEAANPTGGLVDIVFDYSEPDRGRADVETENKRDARQ